jgi:hypothetical protein
VLEALAVNLAQGGASNVDDEGGVGRHKGLLGWVNLLLIQ